MYVPSVLAELLVLLSFDVIFRGEPRSAGVRRIRLLHLFQKRMRGLVEQGFYRWMSFLSKH